MQHILRNFRLTEAEAEVAVAHGARLKAETELQELRTQQQEGDAELRLADEARSEAAEQRHATTEDEHQEQLRVHAAGHAADRDAAQYQIETLSQSHEEAVASMIGLNERERDADLLQHQQQMGLSSASHRIQCWRDQREHIMQLETLQGAGHETNTQLHAERTSKETAEARVGGLEDELLALKVTHEKALQDVNADLKSVEARYIDVKNQLETAATACCETEQRLVEKEAAWRFEKAAMLEQDRLLHARCESHGQLAQKAKEDRYHGKAVAAHGENAAVRERELRATVAASEAAAAAAVVEASQAKQESQAAKHELREAIRREQESRDTAEEARREDQASARHEARLQASRTEATARQIAQQEAAAREVLRFEILAGTSTRVECEEQHRAASAKLMEQLTRERSCREAEHTQELRRAELARDEAEQRLAVMATERHVEQARGEEQRLRLREEHRCEQLAGEESRRVELRERLSKACEEKNLLEAQGKAQARWDQERRAGLERDKETLAAEVDGYRIANRSLEQRLRELGEREAALEAHLVSLAASSEYRGAEERQARHEHIVSDFIQLANVLTEENNELRQKLEQIVQGGEATQQQARLEAEQLQVLTQADSHRLAEDAERLQAQLHSEEAARRQLTQDVASLAEANVASLEELRQSGASLTRVKGVAGSSLRESRAKRVAAEERVTVLERECERHRAREAEAEARESLLHRQLRDGEHCHAITKAQADSEKEAKEALLQRLASVEARAKKDAQALRDELRESEALRTCATRVATTAQAAILVEQQRVAEAERTAARVAIAREEILLAQEEEEEEREDAAAAMEAALEASRAVLRQAAAKRGLDAARSQMAAPDGIGAGGIRAIAASEAARAHRVHHPDSHASSFFSDDKAWSAPGLAADLDDLLGSGSRGYRGESPEVMLVPGRGGVEAVKARRQAEEVAETMVSAYMMQSLSLAQRVNMVSALPGEAERVGALSVMSESELRATLGALGGVVT